MKHPTRLLAVIPFVGLAACASSGNSSSTTPETAVSAPPPSDFVSEDFLRVGALEAQELERGECGLFLFSGRPSPRFVFFGEAASGVGKMIINQDEVVFARTKGQGGVVDLHFTEQTYIAPAYGLTVDITFAAEAEGAVDGTRISQGTLKLVRDNGWSMVMPVGGATSCATQ